ncbi:peptidase M24, structural domain-containing protein [Gorgonomyces haynaldii]|nr:peptidase M24, structural domain-containing protein [Gorgonomyces haynaldii]
MFRRNKLLSPEKRLQRFGKYELITPQLVKSKEPTRLVPLSIKRPEYVDGPTINLKHTHINTPDEIKGMEQAGRLAKQILSKAIQFCEPGKTTLELDEFVHDEIIASHAYPSPLLYNRFPRSCCTSINNVVCHGIPDDRPLRDGDIMNIDITVYLNGFHGDTSAMVQIGQVDDKGKLLCEHTKEAMDRAIEICKPGVQLKEIGQLIQKIADRHGYSVNPSFCGHGIGRYFHQPPYIIHSDNHFPGILQEGMTFTIEPIFCQGRPEFIKWPDDWTAVTSDGGRAAQYEHTILLLSDGPKILTL